MDRSSYQQAFARIRAEYLEMPGMRLTAAQVHRLSGVDISTCTLYWMISSARSFSKARPTEAI